MRPSFDVGSECSLDKARKAREFIHGSMLDSDHQTLRQVPVECTFAEEVALPPASGRSRP